MENDRYLLLDGALGTALIAAGMPVGVCPEEWILEDPKHVETVRANCRAYAESGARFLYTPTFGANRAALSAYGLEDQVGDFNRRLCAITRGVADERELKPLVCGDLSPTGKFLKPMGDASFQELIDIYEEQIRALAPDCDAFVCETNLQLCDARAALFAARRVCPEKPFFASFTVENGTRTLAGTDVCAAAVTLWSLGAKAVGVNCSKGPDSLGEVIEKLSALRPQGKWILCKPNAGLPDENGAFSMTPEDFALHAAKLCDLGADLIGGCCGTTPAHLTALAARLPERKSAPAVSKTACLACERRVFAADEVDFGAPITVDDQFLSNFDFTAASAHLYLPNADALDVLENNLCFFPECALCFSAETPEILRAALTLYQGRAAVRMPSFSAQDREEILQTFAPILFDE